MQDITKITDSVESFKEFFKTITPQEVETFKKMLEGDDLEFLIPYLDEYKISSLVADDDKICHFLLYLEGKKGIDKTKTWFFDKNLINSNIEKGELGIKVMFRFSNGISTLALIPIGGEEEIDGENCQSYFIDEGITANINISCMTDKNTITDLLNSYEYDLNLSLQENFEKFYESLQNL